MANIQAQRFGVREICNVTFKAKSDLVIGGTTFKKGQPVLYIDSAKTSTLEGASTTVYATGGRGNARLIAWEGERTLTFTVEDALLSPISFSMLSGAGLLGGESATDYVHAHTTSYAVVSESESSKIIDLSSALTDTNETAVRFVCPDAPFFIMRAASDGAIYGKFVKAASMSEAGVITLAEGADGADLVSVGDTVFVDYYVVKPELQVTEMQIDAENFGGYFYVEADTLYRAQEDGKDYPAIITLPNVKIQSNFTFSMASSGDPSTFTFTMDAFPGYTYFNKIKKVLCVIQVIDETNAETKRTSVMTHTKYEDNVADSPVNIIESQDDSLPDNFIDTANMGTTAAPYYVQGVASTASTDVPDTEEDTTP